MDRLENVPLVRLEDCTHVPAFFMGQPQAFLPTDIETEFPTVRRSVCGTPQAKRFLQSLNLTEPNAVDDVIRNLLPKYQGQQPNSAQYASDIARILHAFQADSAAQKEKLIDALKASRFVIAKEMDDGSSSFQWPDHLYLATARFKELFQGVRGIYIVDDTQECLRGEDVRVLLEACGATRYIFPIEVNSELSWDEKHKLRIRGGCVDMTYEGPINDYDLRGLQGLLAQLPALSRKARVAKARLLWESLIELQDRRGQSVFSGTYQWRYQQWRRVSFDAFFIQQLNECPWVPDPDGDLQVPSSVLFELLEWPPDPYILSKIHFKKPIVEELAREAGFEPDMLDMLKKMGLTSVAQLMARLNIDVLSTEATDGNSMNEDKQGGTEPEPANGSPRDWSAEQLAANLNDGGPSVKRLNAVDDAGQPHETDDDEGSSGTGSSKSASRSTGDAGQRSFISYVATHPDDGEEGKDPDGVEHAERLALEVRAIELIRNREPALKTMPTHNKGFDLIETDANDEPERWIEVKAMKGSLQERPVGLSSVQFEFARQHGEQYWLYIVEYAGDAERSRIVKINNPAGRAGTFTFDKGWISVAELDGSFEKAL